MKRSVLTVAVMIAVAIAAAPQGSHSSGRESVRGLKQLCVVVEDLGSDIQNDGLDRSAVQTDVEVKLGLAGIQVVTCQEASKTPGGPLLVVNINSMLAKDLGLYAVNVELRANCAAGASGAAPGRARGDESRRAENIYNYMDRQRSLDRWEDARKPSCPRFDQG
jgi:hypothetical protein